MYEYLKTLPLTEEQKKKVNEQGYENAPTLYFLCKATPIAIKQWLKLDSLDALASALWNLMTAAEQAAIEEQLDLLKNS